ETAAAALRPWIATDRSEHGSRRRDTRTPATNLRAAPARRARSPGWDHGRWRARVGTVPDLSRFRRAPRRPRGRAARAAPRRRGPSVDHVRTEGEDPRYGGPAGGPALRQRSHAAPAHRRPLDPHGHLPPRAVRGARRARLRPRRRAALRALELDRGRAGPRLHRLAGAHRAPRRRGRALDLGAAPRARR